MDKIRKEIESIQKRVKANKAKFYQVETALKREGPKKTPRKKK